MTRSQSLPTLRRRGARCSASFAARFAAGVVCGIVGTIPPSPAGAQPPVPAAAIPQKEAVDTTPQRLELPTKDGVLVYCSYYPGTRGKRTVPIILIHGWEGPRGAGSGQDLASLALALQREGHAVMVPDLRGHGQSTFRQFEGRPDETIDRDQLRLSDLQAMILDVEAVRSFLVDENNAGRLNLELLCVVGFEMGSIVGLNWIHYDWTVPSWPTFKQGQDVKAFVLVSPEQTFKGLTARRALAHPMVRSELSAMIIYGKDDPESSTGKRLYNSLKRSHRPLPTDREEARRLQDLFLVELATSLRGAKILTSQTLDVTDNIRQFIQRRLVDRQEVFAWRERRRP